MSAADDISKYRLAIDAIDDRIVDLLNERSLIVKSVGKLKRQTLKKGVCYIRAGREAELVRCVYEKLKHGVFPASAAVQIWRLIIGASLSLESELNIICGSSEEVYWLTREYFGNFVPIIRQKKTSDIIKKIANGKAQVAVLPLAKSDWWLDVPQDIKIFACIPFVLQKNENVGAIALARLVPEATGNDASLLKLTSAKKITTQKIHSLFGKHKLSVKVVNSIRNAHLLEVQGFIDDNEKAIAGIKKETGFAITVMGSYAVPLRIQ